jgi:hypothetical protein
VRIAMADVDGDGIPDLVAVPGPGRPAQVVVLSGQNASVLRSFYAFAQSFTGGAFVAAGDVNGDGLADLVFGEGAGGLGRVAIFDSTANGSPTPLAVYAAYGDFGFSGDVRVAVTPALRGAAGAFVVTAPGPGLGPLARAYYALSGLLYGGANAYNPSFTGGVFVAATGPIPLTPGPGPGGGAAPDPSEAGRNLGPGAMSPDPDPAGTLAARGGAGLSFPWAGLGVTGAPFGRPWAAAPGVPVAPLGPTDGGPRSVDLVGGGPADRPTGPPPTGVAAAPAWGPAADGDGLALDRAGWAALLDRLFAAGLGVGEA